jgi:hypothetical protein
VDLGLLFVSLVAFVIGAWSAAFPERRTARTKAHMTAGDDRHFEEQRAYQSYPSLRDPKIVRRNGIALVALSAVGVALAFLLA